MAGPYNEAVPIRHWWHNHCLRCDFGFACGPPVGRDRELETGREKEVWRQIKSQRHWRPADKKR